MERGYTPHVRPNAYISYMSRTSWRLVQAETACGVERCGSSLVSTVQFCPDVQLCQDTVSIHGWGGTRLEANENSNPVSNNVEKHTMSESRLRFRLMVKGMKLRTSSQSRAFHIVGLQAHEAAAIRVVGITGLVPSRSDTSSTTVFIETASYEWFSSRSGSPRCRKQHSGEDGHDNMPKALAREPTKLRP